VLKKVALATFKHRWQHCSSRKHMGHNIYIPDRLPRIRTDILTTGCKDTGIGTEQIDLTEFLKRLRNQIVHLILIGDVCSYP